MPAAARPSVGVGQRDGGRRQERPGHRAVPREGETGGDVKHQRMQPAVQHARDVEVLRPEVERHAGAAIGVRQVGLKPDQLLNPAGRRIMRRIVQ